MGLDMFMFAQRVAAFNDKEPVQIGYWRKHNALHNWFETHYREANPDFKDVFNCVDFEMTEELLDKLEADIKNSKLTPTPGFFFGSTDYDPAEDAAEDLEIVAKAKECLQEGQQVYYTSWW